jgi:hypothetical protein
MRAEGSGAGGGEKRSEADEGAVGGAEAKCGEVGDGDEGVVVEELDEAKLRGGETKGGGGTGAVERSSARK